MNQINNDLGKEFCKILREWLGDQINEVNRLNKLEGYSSDICHSHDFCDPNQAMIDAFKTVINREIDFNSESDIELINDTWDACKQSNFNF